MELQLLFLLLPIAAFSGWWIARHANNKSSAQSRYQDDYFRGLNYLVNEQPDKAIEVFVRMVEVDSETVDTHFALAGLFRRRGEVERAIRIHQNIMARPTLSTRQQQRALYELARDHQAAGLLDRAEGLFQDLVNDREFGPIALRQLLDIYQQERDWQQAIKIAERLRGSEGSLVDDLLTHFLCEIAELALGQGRYDEALAILQRTPGGGDGAVLACLLEGQIALVLGDNSRAIAAFQRVESLGAEFLPEAINPMRQAYQANGADEEWLAYLQALASRKPSTSIVLALGRELRRHKGPDEELRVLQEFLAKHPSVAGVERLIQLQSEIHGEEGLSVLLPITQRLLQANPRYRCGNCGFSSKTLYWQCPGCKRWGTTKPIYGIEGE